MEQIKNANKQAFEWFGDKNPHNWSRAYFRTWPVCDILLNNLCEAFNSAIFMARDKHIVTLLEMIRRYIARRIEAKKIKGTKWNNGVGCRIWKLLEKTKQLAVKHDVIYLGDKKFEVNTRSDEQFAVDLNTWYCGCRKWSLIGLPCTHAMAAIISRGLNPIK